MISLKIAVLICLVGIGLARANDGVGPLVAPGASGAPRFAGLPPLRLQAIQTVGRSVLVARQNSKPDPNAEILRQDVKALSAELDKTLLVTAMTPPTLQVTPLPDNALAEANTARKSSAAGPVGPDRSVLRTRLDQVRQHADRFKGQAPGNPRGPSVGALAAKSSALQDEVRNVLDGSTPADGVAMAKLRERLKPKTLGDVIADRQAAARAAGESVPEPTPTLSTLIRHR